MTRTLSKSLTQTLTVGFLLSAPVCPAQPGADPEPQRFYSVAVLDFESDIEEQPELGSQVGNLLTAFLSAKQGLVTVEREELQKILSEQELGISGTVSQETAAVLGQLTGAKILVTGRTFVLGKELMMVAKIMGTETSRVFGEAVRNTLEDSPARAAEELADKVATTITSNGEQLLAELETRADLVERLRGLVGKKRLPTLSLRIEERHIGSPSFDPTAETEIGRLLQELGFTLVDEARAADKPEVRILGQALSEFGTRRGNLVSCRGSVEIKAVDLGTGTILAVDRQSEVAVDLAERMAAQAALQESATRLVERLVVKLVESR